MASSMPDDASGQQKSCHSDEYLKIPHSLSGFNNTATRMEITRSGRETFVFEGDMGLGWRDRICPKCQGRMHKNGVSSLRLRHLPFGPYLSFVNVPHLQLRCPHCGTTVMQKISFKMEGHNITRHLYVYTCCLLARNRMTHREIAAMTGLNVNVVKAIDLKRLKERYIEGGKIIRPERQAQYLGIDEFLLHKGHRYATIILDLETGHILWLARGKKKQTVYDFIDHVGQEWMSGVKAVACDMNSDFQEAFQDRCPHIDIVFDLFHIMKNFNDKVVSEIRKDEQKRLREEGNVEAAEELKRTRYILTSNLSTLQKKDEEAAEGKILRKGSELFKTEDVVRQPGHVLRYKALVQSNDLLLFLVLVREMLKDAYAERDSQSMMEKMRELINLCRTTENKHLCWFAKLLDTHLFGIVSHARHPISNGKVEGINNQIKTLRRQGYGYPDDEFFFLKLLDMSRFDISLGAACTIRLPDAVNS